MSMFNHYGRIVLNYNSASRNQKEAEEKFNAMLLILEKLGAHVVKDETAVDETPTRLHERLKKLKRPVKMGE